MPVYVVSKRTPAEGEKPRMVKAERRAQVESFLIGDFEIATADAERAAELAGDGVKVEVAA